MNNRRAHSPLPPPREPKRDPYAVSRDRDSRAALPQRRRRSLSPRRGPSPPGQYTKRHRREDEYYDRHDRYGSPRRRGHSPDYGRGYDGHGGYDDYYHQQPPPPPKRSDESVAHGPMSFKRFLLERVPDNVSPAEAQQLYDAYLTQHFGDGLRAKFEQEKNNDSVRATFHPAAFEESLARHREDAATQAAVLAMEIREGKYDPIRPDFNQGLLDSATEQAEDGAAAPAVPKEGPACLWKPDRVAHDYKVAKRLVCVIDHQRGLNLSDNPLLPQVAAPAAEGEAQDAAEDGKAAADGATAAEASADGAEAQAEAPFRTMLSEVESEQVLVDEEDALQDKLGHLDLLLTWLWRVHGIDYYGGKELLLLTEYSERSSHARTIRGPRPEEGEEQDEEEAKADRADLADRVDSVWAARLEQPDPLLQGCQREEIEKRLNDYVESQIRRENDKKWGSSFSNKYFLEKRFVVKHVFNKHQQRLDEQRATIRDELYWLAYESAKKAGHVAERAAAKQREADKVAAARAAAAGQAGEADGAAGEWHGGYEGEEGYVAPPAAAAPGRAAGRLGPMRGRGARVAAAGRGAPAAAGVMSGLPMVDPSMMMMGGLPGPIILPGPGMMGGLPGAMPMGAPMIIDPSMMGGDMGGMPLFIPAPGAGRGMRGGMAGRGVRGRGGRGMMGMAAPPGTKLEGPGYLKHYYDLDAPANNRAVLDYGDL